MKIITSLLSLYILTKPFYFWQSGLPQVSDIILMIAFIVLLFSVRKELTNQAIKENKYYFYFLFFVIIINLLYSIYYYDTSFLIHGLYYIFDALGIILCAVVFKEDKKGAKTVFNNSFKTSLIIQLIIFLLGLGRYYGATRYMGTFNDPNQFAYYCFLSFGLIYLLSYKDRKKTVLLYLLISSFLIIKSVSTGMLVGMVIFLILYCIPVIKMILKSIKRYASLLVLGLPALLIVCSALLTVNNVDINQIIVDNGIFTRLEQKITRASGEGDISLWEERGYDHIYHYPYYILFGAGEGRYIRFEKAYHQDEIHATLPSFLFCYGIIPTSFVLVWLYQKIKNQRFEMVCVFVALLLESFTLINSRQVLFWTIFLVPQLFLYEGKNE